jgi:hypothetical protein
MTQAGTKQEFEKQTITIELIGAVLASIFPTSAIYSITLANVSNIGLGFGVIGLLVDLTLLVICFVSEGQKWLAWTAAFCFIFGITLWVVAILVAIAAAGPA